MRPRFALLRRAWLLFLILWLVLVAHAALRITFKLDVRDVPYVVGTDSNCYYAFAHSLCFDRDVNFLNQYAFIIRTQPDWQGGAFREFIARNPGKGENPFPAGTGLAAIPFLAVTQAVVLLLKMAGFVGNVSPFALIYVLAFYTAQITYGLGAIWLVLRFLGKHFDPWPSRFAVAATVLCGPTIYYFLYDQGMPHLAGAFFAALTVLAWSNWRAARKSRPAALWALVAGLGYGMAVSVRPYNAPLVLLLAEPLFCALCPVAVREPKPVVMKSRVAIATVIAAIGALIGFLPQLLVWHAQYGTWIANQQGHTFRLLPPHLLKVLFSRRHGLFFWSPFFVAAFAGLILAMRTRRRMSVLLLLVFCGTWWMMGNWRVWWLGVSFGMRGFIDLMYVFAFGFAALVTWMLHIYPRRARLVAVELMLLFTLLNVHLMTAWRSGAILVDGPLYYVDSVLYPDRYEATLRRDWQSLTHFSPSHRASLVHR